jgi:hypothetical protein
VSIASRVDGSKRERGEQRTDRRVDAFRVRDGGACIFSKKACLDPQASVEKRDGKEIA